MAENIGNAFTPNPIYRFLFILILGLSLRPEITQADNIFAAIPADNSDNVNSVSANGPVTFARQVTDLKRGSDVKIEEILVTASRRETSLQELSMSVSVISGSLLHDAGARQFEDYASLVPGLSFGKALGFNKLTLRGVASGSLGEHQPTVGLYLDETPMPQTQSGFESHPDPHLLDVDRMEVLRGPQGTLYGAGAMGGVLKIIHNQPNVEHQEGQLEGFMATTDGGEPSYLTQGTVNLPLVTEQVALRASAFKSQDGGYIDNIDRGNDVNDFSRRGGRLTLGWHINDSIRLTASTMGQEDKLDSFGRDDHAYPRYTQAGSISEPREDQWSLSNVTIESRWQDIDLVYNLAFLDRDVESTTDLTFFMQNNFGAPIPTTVINTLEDRNWTHELRLHNDAANRWNWLVGIYYQNSDAVFDQDTFAPGLDDLLEGATEFFGAKDKLFITMYDLHIEQTDLFGELSYLISDHWRLTVGNRWHNIDQDFDRSQLGLFHGGFNGLSERSSEHGTTPRVSLSYLPDSQSTYYATYAEGFRPGGSNENLSGDFCLQRNAEFGIETSGTFKSDSLQSFELGLRKQWQTIGLYVSGAAYRIERRDMPVAVFPECGITINVADATSEGAEIEIGYQPIDALELTLALAYINSQIDRDTPQAALAKGDPIPMVPEWSTNIAATYRFALPNGWRSILWLNYQFVDDRTGVFGLEGFGGEKLPAYSIVDFQLTLVDRQLEYRFSVDNLFNEDAVYFRHENLLFNADIVSRPRTAGLGITYHF